MSEKFRTSCPNCNSTYRVDAERFGKQVKCPRCQEAFTVSSVTLKGRSGETMSVADDPTPIDSDGLETVIAQYAGKKEGGEPAIGELGRFQLMDILGQGGFGIVYRAFDPLIDREVALKVPRFSGDDQRRMQRFLSEAKAVGRLRHPNIVGVFETGEVEGKPYIVSEYVKGQPLDAWLKVQRPDHRQAAEWTQHLAEALAYAHSEGIVHRDIKPQNIMLDERGRVRIMDFGLAKRTDLDSSVTVEGSIMGTPHYMAPEQAKGETDQVGPHSDQFSLGVVLYQMLTGRKPFDGEPHVVLAKVTREEPPAPRSIDATIPRDIEAICLKAMEKEIPRRFGSLVDMEEDLRRWQAGEPTQARPISVLERTIRWCRRNRTVAALIAAVVAISLTGTIVTSLLWDEASEAATTATNLNTQLEGRQKELVQTVRSRDDALEERQHALDLSQLQMAHNAYASALNEYQSGDPGKGILHAVQALTIAPDTEAGRLLSTAIRANISNYRPSLLKQQWSWHLDASIFHLSVSPDGTTIATGDNEGYVRFWDTNSGEQRFPPLTIPSGIQDIRFVPNSSLLCILQNDGLVVLWNPQTASYIGEPLQSTKAIIDAGLSKQHTANWGFSADGTTVILRHGQGIQVWNPSTGALATRSGGDRKTAPSAVAINDDASIIAAWWEDRTLRIWDLSDGRIGNQLYSGAHAIVAPVQLQISGDRNESVLAGKSYSPFWITIEDGKVHEPGQYSGRTSTSFCAFSSHKEVVATGSYDGEIETHKPLGGGLALDGRASVSRRNKPGIVTEDHVTAMKYSNDEMVLATGHMNGVLRLWNASDLTRIGQDIASDATVQDISFTDSGDALVIITGRKTSPYRGNVSLWSIASARSAFGNRGSVPHAQHPLFLEQGGVHIYGMHTSGSKTTTIRVNDNGRFTDFTIDSSDDCIRDVAFEPKLRVVAAFTDLGSLHLWNIDKPQESWSTMDEWGIDSKRPHLGNSALTFSPSGEWLAVARRNTLRVLNTRSRQWQPYTFKLTAWIESLTFSTDSNTLTSGSAKTVSQYRVDTGGKIATTIQGSVKARCMIDGFAAILTHESDGCLHLRDVDHGGDLREPLPVDGSVLRLVLSKSGNRCVVHEDGDIVRCLDCDSMRWVGGTESLVRNEVVAGHDRIYRIAIDSSGQRVFVGFLDGKYCVWDIATGAPATNLVQQPGQGAVGTFVGGSDYLLTTTTKPEMRLTHLGTGLPVYLCQNFPQVQRHWESRDPWTVVVDQGWDASVGIIVFEPPILGTNEEVKKMIESEIGQNIDSFGVIRSISSEMSSER